MPRLALALSLAGLLAPAIARAERCPGPAWAPALAQADASARLDALADGFDREVSQIHLWSWTWGSTYAAATVAQVSVIPFVADGARTDLAVGAVSAGLGSASLFLLPLRISRPLTRVRARWGEPDRCALLAEAELALIETAEIQRLSTGWIPHLGNVLVNGALALVLGWGYGRWTPAAISAAVGLVIGEANVLTQPRGLPALVERYRALAPDRSPPASSWQLAPVLSPDLIGLTFALRI